MAQILPDQPAWVKRRHAQKRAAQPRGEAGLTLSATERRGFKVSAVDIVFRGRCSDCAAKGLRRASAVRSRRARTRRSSR